MDEEQYVPGKGPLGARIAIVGESPANVEIQTKTPFSGPSGKELDRILKDAGLNRSDCWITNVCKYWVPPASNIEGVKPIPFQVRAKNHGIDLGEQIQDLQRELNEINPNCILALGGTALWAATGKTKISN